MSSGLFELDKQLVPEVPLVPGGEPGEELAVNPPVLRPLAGVEDGQASESPSLNSEVQQHLLSGTSALGLSVAVERGAGLLANVLAARLGGRGVFGAYSFAVGTANQISMYAAGGIGATATRFSGKYPRGSAGYPTLRRALAVVSLVSAVLAAVALWLGSGPVAALVGKPSMANLLHWAALSSVGIILLECARGFFVGQRHLRALLVLSLLVGGGMALFLPWMAHRGSPRDMLVVQGSVATGAVLLCVLAARPLGLAEQVLAGKPLPLMPMLREVWTFGGMQLASLVGSNLSGWWLSAVVARGDASLVQISFLTIGNQLRNLVALAPSLLTEGSYAVMADPRHEETQTPQRVMALCSYASVAVSLLLALAGMATMPWALSLLYGHAYVEASITVALALATAVAHMGNAPAAARLTIVSLRSAAVINTVWAVLVAGAATLLWVRGGSAALAMGVYFSAHLVSALLVLLVLRRRDNLPAGMVALFLASMGVLIAASAFTLWRSLRPASAAAATAGLFACFAGSVALLYLLGRRYDWLPDRAMLLGLLRRIWPQRLRRLGRV